MHYNKFKESRFGRCQICLQEANLTWDHVPPKCVVDVEPYELAGLLDYLDAKSRVVQPFLSQNGAKFRTLCAECNNRLARYDRALLDLVEYVRRLRKTQIETPTRVEVQCRPTAVVRAVLGHLLAVSLTGGDGSFAEVARRLVLDEDLPVPRELNVFYWLHPFQYVVAVKSFSIYCVGRIADPVGKFALLTFFPLGFLISELATFEGLSSFSRWGHLATTEEVSVPLDLKRRFAHDWPEKPDDNTIICINADEAVGAHPRRIRTGNWLRGDGSNG